MPYRRLRVGYTVVVFVVLTSLDNAAAGLVPPLYSPISAYLQVGEGKVSLVTAVSFFVTAVAAVVWAYVGDRTDRRLVLVVGTMLWSLGIGLCATRWVGGYAEFFTAQLAAAVGLGAVASVGFSVVSDLVAPARRGLTNP